MTDLITRLRAWDISDDDKAAIADLFDAKEAEIARLRAQVEAADRAIAAIFDDVGYRPEDLGAEAQEVITAYQQAKESKE